MKCPVNSQIDECTDCHWFINNGHGSEGCAVIETHDLLLDNHIMLTELLKHHSIESKVK